MNTEKQISVKLNKGGISSRIVMNWQFTLRNTYS